MAASTNLTPEQRTQRARLAALTRWGRKPKEERRSATEPARRALHDRLLAEIDAEHPGLADVERHRLADVRVREHMTRLAFASSKSRGKAAKAK